MGLVSLSILALVVGAVTGVGAALLRVLIAVVHNAVFLGEFGWSYVANDPTPPSQWGPFVILAPVVGGLIVLFLVRRFAPEAKGHGVPEVMAAIFYNNGRIRPVVVIIKSLASALSIGSGASVGREGPIIQIGSGIGSTLGQLCHLARWQTITLVAAGAGAGIAATFNTPLGAVMFTIELMLPEVSARTFLPVVLATSTATYVGRIFFGIEPAFTVPTEVLPELLFPSTVQFLPVYVVFGILCGGAAALFVWFLHWVEDFFDDMPLNPYVKNVIGMTCLGVMMYVFFLIYGRYFTDGVGYATIQSILNGDMTFAYLMAILFFAKLLATSISLASGASGGVFSPSLFLGATLGGCFGAILTVAWPHLGLGPIQFAIIGMAAIVGGGTGAAMTGILMIFEMTGDYTIIVPVTIAVAAAIGTRRVLMEDNIYTMKLARRGQHIPKERHSHMFTIRKVRDLMAPVVARLTTDDLNRQDTGCHVRDASALIADHYATVEDARGHLVGVLPTDAQGRPLPGAALITTYTIIIEGDFVQALMTRLAKRNTSLAVVLKERGAVRPYRVTGVVHRDGVAKAILDEYRG
ncbi:chloride channel protein [Roseospira marina]|uniref:Chloride channel protein n=1 Tax=Roseospira marina TaxID=140057 RepID=A0A5M6I788_9PROT|nr:chloride channel protein [Roseospira marina]KAA5604134.1 chloride channel protein [Roseospira marina]MBB4315771.1 CIC family chloride channel protein [Roseospira marina]MBB5088938.1 CIC family chloride channel protein [Roseospira marina]